MFTILYICLDLLKYEYARINLVITMKNKKKSMMIKLTSGVVLVAVILTSSYLVKLYSDKQVEVQNSLQKSRLEKGKKQKSKLKIDEDKVSSIHNVMIVAHPDDEILWGGEQLLKDDYLVICLTNGDNKVRREEFEKAMKETKDYGIILNYPDNPHKVKSKWEKEKKGIKEDIAYILGYKKWNKIVTHNPDGEYGHIHHKMTSKMVSDESKKADLTNQLLYFGKYYKKDDLVSKEIIESLNEEESKKKKYIMETIYTSQAYAYHLFEHMIPYEKLISFSSWY